MRSRPLFGGAAGGTAVSGAGASRRVIHASYTSYGTRFTSEAALITPTWPWGSPPEEWTPLDVGLSEDWSAPVTVTSPDGGAGTLAASADTSAAPGSQPRTTGRAFPPSVRSRVRT
ncbi:hypothetical protein GCM10010214_54420 [Streptomyces abikoensis]|nr:hypothetical protein GCM10010214_54420 [Streptomyces abikoensis]